MREGYEDLFSKHEPDELLRELNGNVLWHYLPMNPNDERKPVSSMAPFHAAAEIELLRAENERLREALFAIVCNTEPDAIKHRDYDHLANAIYVWASAALGKEN